MRRSSPLRHNLARLRQHLGLGQQEMADAVGCSRDTIQSVELRRLPLSEELARRIASATDVHLRWLLENDPEAPIVRGPGGRCSYTKSDFENAQALSTVGEDDRFMQELALDYAISFYGQVRAILSAAVKKNRGELAAWKIAKFLEDCRKDFGHDERLIREREQFGVRAEDDMPYLRFRQVMAGKELAREYLMERDAEEETAKQQAKQSAKKAARTRKTPARSKRDSGQRRRRKARS